MVCHGADIDSKNRVVKRIYQVDEHHLPTLERRCYRLTLSYPLRIDELRVPHIALFPMGIRTGLKGVVCILKIQIKMYIPLAPVSILNSSIFHKA